MVFAHRFDLSAVNGPINGNSIQFS